MQSESRSFIFILFFLFVSIVTYACDCPPLKPLNKNIVKEYPVIFEGEIDSISGELVYFNVGKVFSGNVNKYTAVLIKIANDCQFTFFKAQKWLVYASLEAYGKLHVDFCSRTRMQFESTKDDYYAAVNAMPYKDEVFMLKQLFGEKKPIDKIKAVDNTPVRKLIQPEMTSKLVLLVISIVFLGVLYYVIRKYLR